MHRLQVKPRSQSKASVSQQSEKSFVKTKTSIAMSFKAAPEQKPFKPVFEAQYLRNEKEKTRKSIAINL